MGKRGRSSLENDEYIVEKILKRRTVNGQKEALVKWKDYSTKFNTWEPIDNIRTFLNANKSSKRARTSTDENDENDESDFENEEEPTSTENEKENAEEPINIIKHIRSKSREKQNKIKLLFSKKKSIEPLETIDKSKTSLQFDHQPPEVEKIIGKRIRPGNSIEYLIKFNGLSSKHNIWEPSDNKDIQLKIAAYEASLVKESVKAFIITKVEPIDSEKETKRTEVNNNSLSEVKTNMKKVNFEIFENENTYLLVKGENNFIQLDKSSNKNEICRAVLNMINNKENKDLI